VSDPKVVDSSPERNRGTSAVSSPLSTKLKSVASFLLLSFPIGIFWFLVLGTLILLGIALSIIWVGLPILALALTLVTRGAQSERRRLGRSLGIAVPAPYRSLPQGSWFKRARSQVKDPAVRRDLAYLLLLLPVVRPSSQ